nr:hypothetical protein [Lysinibacillus timonensis]
MFTQIQVKNGLLNLPQLQAKMDEMVFDYIDSSQKWEKAYKGLDNLLQQTVSNFANYIDRQNGSFPESNVYWNLFADILAQLIYFKTLAQKQISDMKIPEVKEYILYSYTVAAKCIIHFQEHLLDEISKSFEDVELLNGKEGAFKEAIKNANNDLDKCLKQFYEFSISYNKIKQY